MKKRCQHCGEVIASPWAKRQKYCSRKCVADSKRGSGTRHKYVKLNGRHAHRVIAERMLGRPLRTGEIVHHVDGDGHNNAESNLEVLESQAEHARLHSIGTKHPWKKCKFGHDLTGDNVLMVHKGEWRRCLTCARAYSRNYRLEHKHVQKQH